MIRIVYLIKSILNESSLTMMPFWHCQPLAAPLPLRLKQTAKKYAVHKQKVSAKEQEHCHMCMALCGIGHSNSASIFTEKIEKIFNISLAMYEQLCAFFSSPFVRLEGYLLYFCIHIHQLDTLIYLNITFSI